jgi:Fe2+ transport system protein B
MFSFTFVALKKWYIAVVLSLLFVLAYFLYIPCIATIAALVREFG